jgi:fructose-1,6-bisphosphatase/sedoheptulose 1,7-bisphosphatase-like protein
VGVISHDVRSGSKPDRNLALELVRVTEAAALAAARWVGKGEKESADQAAVDAMRLLLDTVPMDGTVVIGEGEKDEAPMLYNGEQIGDGSPPRVDIAVDPLEGTTLTARGMPSALAVIALSERDTMFDPGPCVYMEKVAGGPDVADALSLDDPLGEVVERVAERKGKSVGDVTVIMLDRPRHEDGVKQIREAGARIRFISDGDVSAALFAVSAEAGVDLLWGIGGTPEGVLSAAAPRPAVAARRGRAPRRRRRGLRPRRGPRRRPARLRRRRLLRGQRRHGRRPAPGRALYPRRQGDHRVAGDALAIGHGANGQRPPRPGEASRGHRRPVRLAR